MRCGYVVLMRWMVIYVVPGGALNLNSVNYPDHGHHGDPPVSGKIPMVELGIDPGTSGLVVRNADHWTTRLIHFVIILWIICPRLISLPFIGLGSALYTDMLQFL
jgi:hypothetical protein